MLEIQDLHVSVHGTPVLKGIDLKVEAGETFILFGPNGSSKTAPQASPNKGQVERS